MNVSTEVDESVLVINTVENFQILCTLLYPHVEVASHMTGDPYIRIDLSSGQAFYSAGERKQPLISLDFLMQLWLLPTYEAKVVFIVENITLPDYHPWKNMYEQFLRDSM